MSVLAEMLTVCQLQVKHGPDGSKGKANPAHAWTGVRAPGVRDFCRYVECGKVVIPLAAISGTHFC
jgi:hypothetical protein